MRKIYKMNKRKAIIFTFLFTALTVVFAAGKTVDTKVYITAKGKKYHYHDCRTLKKAKKLTELTVKQAQAKGYEACKVCKPPRE